MAISEEESSIATFLSPKEVFFADRRSLHARLKEKGARAGEAHNLKWLTLT